MAPLWAQPIYLYHEVTEVRRAVNVKLFVRAISLTYFPSTRAAPALYI